MKKRIFHGKVNDVEFNDRDAMLNYVKDLVDHNEPIRDYATYYEVVYSESEPADDDTVNAAMRQLDLSDFEAENFIEPFLSTAEERMETELTNRMSNLITILDAATPKQIDQIIEEYRKIFSKTMPRMDSEEKNITDLYTDLVNKNDELHEKLAEIMQELDNNEKDRDKAIIYGNIYENIKAWCCAMSDILADYKTK